MKGSKMGLTPTPDSKMHTIEKPKFEDYENRLVAFIDVLGFENLVGAADRGTEPFEKIADLLGFMKGIEETLKGSHFKEVLNTLEVSAMSDSLIVSALFEPNRPQSVLDFLYYIKSLQIRFIGDHQTLTRGYLCSGKMYHHNNVIFGVPYIKAFQCEKAVRGPKIAIDPDLEEIITHADAETKFTDAKELTRRDDDGWRFVNYLQDPNLPTGNTFPYSDVLPKITEFLWTQLRTQRDGVLQKYQWLQNYIDTLIRENKCPAAEISTLAFSQSYSLTKTLSQYSGQKVYFYMVEEPYPEYWNLLNGEVPCAKLLSSTVVPEGCLSENCDIRSDKISEVKRFLVKLGAYPAEAEKIISTKSGKTVKMKNLDASERGQCEATPV